MASSQVRIASNPPFDCILRDHNRRDRYGRESRAAFQKNLKDLVRDRLQSCMSTPLIVSDSDSNENSNPPTENAEPKSRNEQSNKPHHIRRKSKANERWNRTREMVFAIDNPEGPNQGGVSSLVKKWRDFEAESKNLNSNKSNSNSPSTENPSIETPQSNSRVGESIDERIENSTTNYETLPDWESETTANSGSGPPSSAGRDSGATESERTKVADIIKKLKNENVGTDSIPRVRTSLSDQIENRGLCQVLCSPRIRGRQALSDLLMQMERDRQHELQGLGERKPVSKFSHKGRIQALLRIKLLRRGSELRDHRLLSPTTCKLNGVASKSTIMHLRERFSALVDHCASNPTHIIEEVDKTQQPENSSTSYQQEDTSFTRSLKESEITSTSKRPREEIHHIEVSASITHLEEKIAKTSGIEDSSTSKRPREENHQSERTCSTSNRGEFVDNELKEEPHHENANQEQAHSSCDFETRESEDKPGKKLLEGSTDELEEREAVKGELREADDDWGMQSEGEEERTIEGNSNNDWISDIARPKSDWEGLRKARYQEMLDPYTEKGDIRVLLQRRSVSTFLSSGLKERIERLMISRSQGQSLLPQLAVNNADVKENVEQCHYEEQDESEYEEEDEEEDDNDDEDDEEYDEDEEEEEEEEESSPLFGEYLFRTCRSNRSDDFDQFTSPSLMQSPSSNSYSQSSRQRSSVEMELIYDMRGHMEQLHREMSEIRKSIKSCVAMQAKLHRSIKREVVTAVSHSGRRHEKESLRRVPKKDKCCICNEKPIDSLLYRCGHMCTCFKCGHELQWNGGKCPLCTAPILDIVRPYAR